MATVLSCQIALQQQHCCGVLQVCAATIQMTCGFSKFSLSYMISASMQYFGSVAMCLFSLHKAAFSQSASEHASTFDAMIKLQSKLSQCVFSNKHAASCHSHAQICCKGFQQAKQQNVCLCRLNFGQEGASTQPLSQPILLLPHCYLV